MRDLVADLSKVTQTPSGVFSLEKTPAFLISIFPPFEVPRLAIILLQALFTSTPSRFNDSGATGLLRHLIRLIFIRRSITVSNYLKRVFS